MISGVYSLWPNDYSQPPDIFVIPNYNRGLPIVQWYSSAMEVAYVFVNQIIPMGLISLSLSFKGKNIKFSSRYTRLFNNKLGSTVTFTLGWSCVQTKMQTKHKKRGGNKVFFYIKIRWQNACCEVKKTAQKWCSANY